MKQTNISIFIPHVGCKNTCSFCNQRTISGKKLPVTKEELKSVLLSQVNRLRENNMTAQIAFFGGSFTAIDKEYMLELLEASHEFLEEYPDCYTSLRCSTRPDAIDEETLRLLAKYGMRSIELGAQSMSDEVLAANHRGHTASDVENASKLIKKHGFELGLQMMTGLYKDTPERCLETARRFIELGADTVRIYPTVILEGTELDELRKSGEYQSFSFDDTVELCCKLLGMFEKAGIPVIRLGLHASEEVEGKATGGVYHPALREICESREILHRIEDELTPGKYIFYTDKKNISKIIGQKSFNRLYLAEKGITFKIKEERGTLLRTERFS